MTWQNCDDCGATLLVTIPYDGRSLCHSCWEDAKENGCGTGGPMGDNHAGDEPTTVNVSIEMFEQAIVHERCRLCGGIRTSSHSGGLCQLCHEKHMERCRKKIYSWYKRKRMERCQKMYYDMRAKEATG